MTDMAEQKLLQCLLSAEMPYTPFESLELPEETEKGTYVVKCEEDAYLLVSKDGWRFFDRASGSSVSDPGVLPASRELAGWRAELSYAPDRVAVCDFGADSLTCEGEVLPVRIASLRPGLILAAGTDGRFALVVDTARFLFYGSADGTPFGGCVRNMPQDS